MVNWIKTYVIIEDILEEVTEEELADNEASQDQSETDQEVIAEVEIPAEEVDEEEDLPEVDPALKVKLMPMAMMKAKKSAGDEEWKLLSSEEKTRLTDLQVRKLAALS